MTHYVIKLNIEAVGLTNTICVKKMGALFLTYIGKRSEGISPPPG